MTARAQGCATAWAAANFPPAHLADTAVAPEPRLRHLPIQMEIADIPPLVDSGDGMGHISRQEPPSQPNTPTLRAPVTGLNEKLVKVQRCPATVGPGCTRSRGEPGLRLAEMFRPSRKGAGIAGTIAMRSAPLGQGVFVGCARAYSERERVSIRFQSVPQGNAQYQTRKSRHMQATLPIIRDLTTMGDSLSKGRE